MTSEFAPAFEEVTAFLQSEGVTPTVESTDPASPTALERFTQVTRAELPRSFSDFYTTFSNGFRLSWESGDEWGNFSMPSLESLAEMRRVWIETTQSFAEDPQSMDQCIDPPFREAAFRIWSRMKNWCPFFEEMDGDAFCLDLTTGSIVFDKHDWFDGFGEIAATNGLIAGSSLIDFIHTWGRYCFSPMWFTDAPHLADQTHLVWRNGICEFERS